MAAARRQRLKVFAAPFGFFDTIVAAPSRAAALRAWETRQDLFREGYAQEIHDADAVAAATAHPGRVLKRPVGSKAAYEADPGGLPRVPAGKPARRGKTAAKSAAKPERPPPDRSELDRAEVALAKLEAAREREEADLARRREALDDEIGQARKAYVAARRAALDALADAKARFRKAAGTPR